jgi:hypothetical protein
VPSTDCFNCAIDRLWFYCVTKALGPDDTELGLAICDAYLQRPVRCGYSELGRNRATMQRIRRQLVRAATDSPLKDLIEAADTIVVGRARSGKRGKHEDLHKLLAILDYNALLPRHANPSVPLLVKQVLKGSLDKPDSLRFYRLPR